MAELGSARGDLLQDALFQHQPPATHACRPWRRFSCPQPLPEGPACRAQVPWVPYGAGPAPALPSYLARAVEPRRDALALGVWRAWSCSNACALCTGTLE